MRSHFGFPTADEGIVSYSTVMMGSPIVLKLKQPNSILARKVFQLIKQHENLFTVNQHTSEVMLINHFAGRKAIQVSPTVFELIRCARDASLIEGNLFNLAIGPLVKRWKIGFNGNQLPPKEEIQALLKLTDPKKVILNPLEETVYLADVGMQIDLGAIAKGYIADVVVRWLAQQDCTDALINLGGNVHTLGCANYDNPWLVGLKKPFGNKDEFLGIIGVKNKSVVTSGIYERYFILDGKLYHHILNPQTGYPLNNDLHSVTVISDKSIDGEIYTSLFYGLGLEVACSYLQNITDIEAIFITTDGRIICPTQRHFSFTLQN